VGRGFPRSEGGDVVFEDVFDDVAGGALPRISNFEFRILPRRPDTRRSGRRAVLDVCAVHRDDEPPNLYIAVKICGKTIIRAI